MSPFVHSLTYFPFCPQSDAPVSPFVHSLTYVRFCPQLTYVPFCPQSGLQITYTVVCPLLFTV